MLYTCCWTSRPLMCGRRNWWKPGSPRTRSTGTANSGSGTPVFAHGDTLAAVAETVGMDAKTLQGTVDTYNGAVDAGVDKAFGRAANYLTMKIGSGPYYLVEQSPGLPPRWAALWSTRRCK